MFLIGSIEAHDLQETLPVPNSSGPLKSQWFEVEAFLLGPGLFHLQVGYNPFTNH